MASLNMVQLIGFLGNGPEIRYSQSGMPIANMSLATDETYKGANGEPVKKTEWHRLVCFDKTASLAEKYLKKGSQIYVQGSLQTRKWQDQNGQDRYTTEIKVLRMQFLDRKETGNGQQEDQPPQTRSEPTPPEDYDNVPF